MLRAYFGCAIGVSRVEISRVCRLCESDVVVTVVSDIERLAVTLRLLLI